MIHPLVILKLQYLSSKSESRDDIQNKSLICSTWFASTTLAKLKEGLLLRNMAMLVHLVPNSVACSMDRLLLYCLQFFDSNSRSQTAIFEVFSWGKKKENKRRNFKKCLCWQKGIVTGKIIIELFVLEGTFKDHLAQFLKKSFLETQCASSHWWASSQLWVARPRDLMTKALQAAASPLTTVTSPAKRMRIPFFPSSASLWASVCLSWELGIIWAVERNC